MSKVYVYSPEGEREAHTRLNAWDLVNGAGWTWKPGVETSPAAFPAYRTVAPPTEKEPAQAVLDRAGHRNDRSVAEVLASESAADVPDDDGIEEVVEEVAADEAADEVVEAPAPAAPAPRGRAKKA